MSIALKSGVVCLGTGVLTVGTLFIAPGVPYWDSLSKEDNYSTKYSTDTFGNKYGKYLISTKKFAKTNSEVNNGYWWEWSWNNWKLDSQNPDTKEKISSEFKNHEKINSAFKDSENETTTTGSPTSLNKVCEVAYKKQVNEIQKTDSDDNNKKYEEDIWMYCSPLRGKPKNSEKDTFVSGTIGETQKNKLISINSWENSLFWALRNEEFSSNSGNLVPNSDSHKFFHKRKNQNIKTICEIAYGLTKSETSTDDEPTETEVLKFCSLKGE